MSAAFALILLAEAAVTCAPSGPRTLPGGATVVRPVGVEEPLPFELLGPATGIEKPDVIRKTGAASDSEESDSATPAEPCESDPIEIV